MQSATTTTSTPRYIVMISAAATSGRARQFNGRGGRYERVAVMRLSDEALAAGRMPRCIRNSRWATVVDHWTSVWTGSTERSEGRQARAEARRIAAAKNAAETAASGEWSA